MPKTIEHVHWPQLPHDKLGTRRNSSRPQEQQN
jgi:hypothetical protein